VVSSCTHSYLIASISVPTLMDSIQDTLLAKQFAVEKERESGRVMRKSKGERGSRGSGAV
jgi:hypothetical protein